MKSSAPISLDRFRQRVHETRVRRPGASRDNLAAILLLLPMSLLLLTFMFYPIVNTFWLSVHEVNQFGKILSFKGFDNYVSLFGNPSFRGALGRTITWTVGVVGLTTVISLFLAVVLNGKFRGRTLVRSLLMLPWAASLTINTVIWRWIANSDFGSLNHLLQTVGILHGRFDWLATPAFSFPLMIWIGVWVSIPSSTVLILAGLQSIPGELQEAIMMDGARPWSIFRDLTLPLLKPVLVVAILLQTIYAFNSFPIIWVLTEGGPANQTDTLVTHLYKVGFRFYELGKASAVSVIVFVTLLIFAIAYTAVSWKEVSA